jgi:GT2 family glycosyltransferase
MLTPDLYFNKFQCSLILSTWNQPENIAQCFERLIEIREQFNNDFINGCELIVVDNRNQDANQADHVRGNSKAVFDNYAWQGSDKWALVSHSTGCAGGWSIGAHLAEGQILIFVDDKCLTTYKTIKELTQFAFHREKIGMVGVQGGYREVSHNKVILQEQAHDDRPIKVDEVSGFLWATPTTTFIAVGGFDLRFRPAGWEETDYAFNVRKHNYSVYLLPNLDYHHVHDLSAKAVDVEWLTRQESTRPTIDERNKKIFFSKWANFQSVKHASNK